MLSYDRESLESTLTYLKCEYGLGVFTGRSERTGGADIMVILRDFYNMGDHKGEASLLGVVHRNETLKRLVYLKETEASRDVCLAAIRREIKNTVDCFVREDIAEDFVNMLARVIGLNVPEVRIGTGSPAPVVTPSPQSRPAATPAPVSTQRRQGQAMSDKKFLNLCKLGDVRKVEEALWHGANANAKENKGGTALHEAAFRGYSDVAEVLLKYGADVNATSYGETALYNAAGQGNTKVAELLLRYGADVNAKDDDGNTALHTAAGEGEADTVELLLKHGANVNAKNDDGETALHWARERAYDLSESDNDAEEYDKVISLLRAHGAKS